MDIKQIARWYGIFKNIEHWCDISISEDEAYELLDLMETKTEFVIELDNLEWKFIKIENMTREECKDKYGWGEEIRDSFQATQDEEGEYGLGKIIWHVSSDVSVPD